MKKKKDKTVKKELKNRDKLAREELKKKNKTAKKELKRQKRLSKKIAKLQEKQAHGKKKKKNRKGKNLPVKSQFEAYFETLTHSEQTELTIFFEDLKNHVLLPRDEKAEIRRDFERALLYYFSEGISVEQALSRLSISKLGGFYARPPILWYALDDAAKIYPLSMQHGQMSVFRLSISFREPVVPELMQMALTFTIKRFPSFATTVKKGFFWHYLDTAKRRYNLEQETDVPCRPLKISHSGSQAFRVMYYENRLSVEYFHILTDGTGGLVFLKTLAAEYLRLCGHEIGTGEGVLDISETHRRGETANEFSRTEKSAGINGFVDKPALQMSGALSRLKPCRVLHFRMDSAALKAAAEAKNATITAYLLALFFVAGKAATDEPEGDISIQVPVNMRKFYPSDTLRNFAMYCGIRLNMDDITDTQSIVGEISRQLTEKSSRESMSAMMASTGRMVGLMRYVPLFIKAPAAKLVYGFLGDTVFSNTLSNLGVIKLPEGMSEHVESVDIILGTSVTNRAGCALATYGNTATLSISKMTADPSFEERLYALLNADGVMVEVEGSEQYED